MRTEPETKRVCFFVDGQNLFHSVKNSFGFSFPNYDIHKLCTKICDLHGADWNLEQIFFYTGVPDRDDNANWHIFWTKKLARMGREGISVFSRPLRYRNKRVKCPNGTYHAFLAAEEKGIDVRIAIDIIRKTVAGEYDVAVILSQDQDLSEAVDEVKSISKERDRWIKIASAFPISPTSTNRRGVNHSDWIHIARENYDECIDYRNYKPSPSEI